MSGGLPLRRREFNRGRRNDTQASFGARRIAGFHFDFSAAAAAASPIFRIFVVGKAPAALATGRRDSFRALDSPDCRGYQSPGRRFANRPCADTDRGF
jgi:hypothetical protein